MARQARSVRVITTVTPLEARYIAHFAAQAGVTRAAWVYQRLASALRVEAAMQTPAGRIAGIEVAPALKK